MGYKSIIGAIYLPLVLASFAANATPILNVENGQLTGATNVDVNGIFYDVAFKDGTFASIFGGATGLDATDASQAEVFSNAVIDQVFTGIYARNPLDIFGCGIRLSGSPICHVVTPYDLGPSAISAVNFPDKDSGLGQVFASQTTDFSSIHFNHLVWADWSQASVPEPPLFALFGIGLLGMIGAKLKKHECLSSIHTLLLRESFLFVLTVRCWPRAVSQMI